MPSATDELRHMLDTRGVKWRTDLSVTNKVEWTIWPSPWFREVWAKEIDGRISIFNTPMTPAQAIEATLGRGTCHNAMPLLPGGMPYPDSWMCSECGGRMDGIILETGNYCPNCGRKVVDE